MSNPRTLLAVAIIGGAFTTSGCNKNKPEDTTPPLAVTPVSDAGTDTTVGRTLVPEEEKIQVTAAFTGLGDTFAAVKKVGESWMPGNAVDPAAELQAMLLAVGFGPGFYGNLDLSSQHTVFIAAPPGQGGPDDLSFSGAIAVLDGRKLLESTPQEYRPQPLGEGMWELQRDGQRLLIKEAGKELHVGYSTEDVDRASKIKQQIAGGHTFKARATNIPTDQLDPVELLDLPRDSALVKSLAGVLQELKAVELQADLTTTADFSFVAAADAPFSKLGLAPIGEPRGASTALESRLPADPVFVTTVSWGDPKLVHAMMDKMVPLGQIPDPFRDVAAKALESTHTLLAQVANDLVLAMYVDGKGRATFVIAADVKDEAATRTGLRGINEVLVQGVELQKTAAGKNKDQALGVALKNDGLKVGKVKGDQLTVTIPKDFEEDFAPMQSFLDKDKITTVSMVSDGTAVVAIGAGAKTIASDVAKSLGKARKGSLAGHEGLARLRTSMGGCQICMAGDPTAYFGLRLAMLRQTTENKDVAKAARTHETKLGKVGELGDPALGVKVGPDAASLALVVPQTLVFAPTSATEALSEISGFVSDPETWLSEQGGSASTTKPARPPTKSPRKEAPAKTAPAKK